MDYEDDFVEDFLIGLMSPLLLVALFPLFADQVEVELLEKEYQKHG